MWVNFTVVPGAYVFPFSWGAKHSIDYDDVQFGGASNTDDTLQRHKEKQDHERDDENRTFNLCRCVSCGCQRNYPVTEV